MFERQVLYGKVALLCALCLPAAGSVFPAHTNSSTISCLYRETTGSATVDLYWECCVGTPVIVKARKGEKTFLNRMDTSGAMKSWHMHAPGSVLNANRTGNTIAVRGTFDQQPVNRTFAVDDDPWYQALTFSLRDLARGNGAEKTFWMLRQDTFEAVKLRAKKKNREVVHVPAGAFTAWKIRVRPVGILSALWHGDYWYRTTDGLFLRYEGASGLPGSAKTIIELTQEQTG